MQMRPWRTTAAALTTILLFTLAACAHAPLATVEKVDLKKYAGTWYDIAHLPQWFQNGCQATTAEYTANPDGTIAVLNTCRKDALDGPVQQARGTARVVDTQTNAKLKVSFFWPFEGDYWVLRLAPDYSAAAVGGPNRTTLWFLSRTPTLDRALFEKWSRELQAEGFDTSKLEWTPHAAPRADK